jgi:hypothetical protein
MEPEDAILVLLVLLLGPVVLMALVSLPIEGMIMINTFLRDWQKPPPQIITTDTHMKAILEGSSLEARSGFCDRSLLRKRATRAKATTLARV